MFKAFIGLSICAKMIDGDIPFYAIIWRILTHPFQNADFQYIFAHSASTVTPSKKFN